MKNGFRLCMTLLVGTLLSVCLSAQDTEAALDSLRAFIETAMTDWDVPGVSVAVVKGDEVLMAEGFGYRNVEDELPVTENTVFAIGSASKAFTATLLGLLVEDGLIQWEEPVATYLPDFRLDDAFATAEMTPVDLVTHRSGLPRHDFMWYGSDLSRRELYERLHYLKPSRTFRSTFQYQNLMYLTAGVLAEEVTGKTWETQIEERFFVPLGMNFSNTSVAASQEAGDHALPYEKQDDTVQRTDFYTIGAVGPAGSINSTASDMVRWLQLNLNEGLLDEEQIVATSTLQRVHAPHMIVSGTHPDPETPYLLYGLGWFIQPYRGHQLIQHGGNIDGFSAMASLMPEEDLGVVVLTNLNGNPLPGIIARTAYDYLLGYTDTDWNERTREQMNQNDEEGDEDEEETEAAPRVADTSPSHDLEAYTGRFSHPAYGNLEIMRQEDELGLAFHGLESSLEHWHYDIFAATDLPGGFAELKLSFHTNLKGDIDRVTVPLEATVEPIEFTRQAPDTLSDPEFLGRLVGQYLVEGAQPLEINLQGRTLTADLPGQPTYTLEPYQGTEFNLKGLPGFSMRFVLDGDTVEEIVIMQPNGTFHAKPQ